MRPANQPTIIVRGAMTRKGVKNIWTPWPNMVSAMYKVLEHQFVLRIELRPYPILKRQVRPGITNAGTFLLRVKVKVKFTPEQATKAQRRGGISISLLFL
jgi:hypothetical protein